MSDSKESRRSFLKGFSRRRSGRRGAGSRRSAEQSDARPAGSTQPNIILYLSDQFRWDFVGANGQNSSTRTPNLDALAARGKNFTHAVTNQPVCATCAISPLHQPPTLTETGVSGQQWPRARQIVCPRWPGELRSEQLFRQPDRQMASRSREPGARRQPRSGESRGPRRIPRSVGRRERHREHLAPVRGNHLGPRQQSHHL